MQNCQMLNSNLKIKNFSRLYWYCLFPAHTPPPPPKKRVANLKFKIPSTALLKENEIITTNLPWIH
jgi:hypothetical protein